MIFDTLTFCGECLFGWSVPEERLLAALDDAETARAVVCTPKPPQYHFEAANDRTAEVVARHADRLVGLVRVDPWQKSAAAEAERGFVALGLRGLFLHPWEENFRVNAPAVDEIVAVAATQNAPVFIAAGFPWVSEALQAGDLAKRFPRTPFVFTTGGQINISGLGQVDAELAVEANPNVQLQTTGVYREDFIQGLEERFGAQRLLYASGFPQFDPRLERLRVQWAPKLDEAAKRAILSENAEALFPSTAGSKDRRMTAGPEPERRSE